MLLSAFFQHGNRFYGRQAIVKKNNPCIINSIPELTVRSAITKQLRLTPNSAPLDLVTLPNNWFLTMTSDWRLAFPFWCMKFEGKCLTCCNVNRSIQSMYTLQSISQWHPFTVRIHIWLVYKDTVIPQYKYLYKKQDVACCDVLY